MTGIDSSIYGNFAPPPSNPLQTVSQVAGVSNAMQENQLLKNQVGAQQQLGEILAQSTNPDGTRDYAKANNLLATPRYSQYAGINGRLLLDLQNAQDVPEKVYNNETGKYEWRPLQNQQLIATQQAKATKNKLMQPSSGAQNPQPAQSQQINQLTGQPTANIPSSVATNGAPLPGQVGPTPSQIPQAEIDQFHAHNNAILEALTPLANNPNVSENDVKSAIVNMVAHPDVNFNSKDGAALLSKLPHGPNGAPASSQQLQPLIQQELDRRRQIEATLQTKYPSSQQLQARQQQIAQQVPTGQSQVEQQNSQPTGDNIFPEPQPGQEAFQTHYQDVMKKADSVAVDNAALSNIYNLADKGAKSGTLIGKLYQILARTGVVPEGVTDTAAQLQMMQSHSAQLGLSGSPGSDKQLDAFMAAKSGSDDLPQTIKGMIPYLKSVNNRAAAQADYYHQGDPSGNNVAKIGQMRSEFRSFDPRIWELNELAKSDPKSFNDYLSGLSATERNALAEQYDKAQAKGLFK